MRGAALHVKLSGRAGGLGKKSCLISAGVVVLALGFSPGLQAGSTNTSNSETTEPSSRERDPSTRRSENDSAVTSFDERFRDAVDSPVGQSPPVVTIKPLRAADASAQDDSSLLSEAA